MQIWFLVHSIKLQLQAPERSPNPQLVRQFVKRRRPIKQPSHDPSHDAHDGWPIEAQTVQ